MLLPSFLKSYEIRKSVSIKKFTWIKKLAKESKNLLEFERQQESDFSPKFLASIDFWKKKKQFLIEKQKQEKQG